MVRKVPLRSIRARINSAKLISLLQHYNDRNKGFPVADQTTTSAQKARGFDRYVIAVLVPCHNEEAAIAKVVKDFRAALPTARIFVFDNNSTDNTTAAARAAGAEVFAVKHRGKGFVVRRMFTDVEAEIYVLVDGDATYDAPSVCHMIELLLEDRLDMVVGNRVDREQAAYRVGHRTGNWLLTSFVGLMFGRISKDMLSGYRVFSRRFVKSFPVLSGGFEIETELTIHALELGLAVAEIDTPYYARPEGSVSKLNTWHDGFRILRTIVRLYRAERPLFFFTAIGLALAIASIGLAIPIFFTYFKTGLVPRLPTAVLSTGMMVLAFLSVAIGLVLDTVTRGRREMKLLAYLGHRAPGDDRRGV
jgi:glycosyltransferase involved in cell wall biosynthesis